MKRELGELRGKGEVLGFAWMVFSVF